MNSNKVNEIQHGIKMGTKYTQPKPKQAFKVPRDKFSKPNVAHITIITYAYDRIAVECSRPDD